MDASSLTGVESATLTQGVAFLYAQAGELLRRRREARDRAGAAGEQGAGPGAPAHTLEPLPALELPEGVFESPGAAPASPRPDVLDQLARRLLEARREVEEYVAGTAVLDRDAPAGLQAADRLRCLLEDVYHTALTFPGEQRQARTGAVTYRGAQHGGGVVVMGNVSARGVAGRDIINNF
jgi:hypothetical protein